MARQISVFFFINVLHTTLIHLASQRTQKSPEPPTARLRELVRKMSVPLAALLPLPALARQRGAFELDSEIYLRNLLQMNGAPASKLSKARRPIYKSPRKMDESAAIDLLDIVQRNICDLGECSRDFLQSNVSL